MAFSLQPYWAGETADDLAERDPPDDTELPANHTNKPVKSKAIKLLGFDSLDDWDALRDSFIEFVKTQSQQMYDQIVNPSANMQHLTKIKNKYIPLYVASGGCERMRWEKIPERYRKYAKDLLWQSAQEHMRKHVLKNRKPKKEEDKEGNTQINEDASISSKRGDSHSARASSVSSHGTARIAELQVSHPQTRALRTRIVSLIDGRDNTPLARFPLSSVVDKSIPAFEERLNDSDKDILPHMLCFDRLCTKVASKCPNVPNVRGSMDWMKHAERVPMRDQDDLEVCLYDWSNDSRSSPQFEIVVRSPTHRSTAATVRFDQGSSAAGGVTAPGQPAGRKQSSRNRASGREKTSGSGRDEMSSAISRKRNGSPITQISDSSDDGMVLPPSRRHERLRPGSQDVAPQSDDGATLDLRGERLRSSRKRPPSSPVYPSDFNAYDGLSLEDILALLGPNSKRLRSSGDTPSIRPATPNNTAADNGASATDGSLQLSPAAAQLSDWSDEHTPEFRDALMTIEPASTLHSAPDHPATLLGQKPPVTLKDSLRQLDRLTDEKDKRDAERRLRGEDLSDEEEEEDETGAPTKESRASEADQQKEEQRKQELQAIMDRIVQSAKHSIAENSKGHMERVELSKYEQAAGFLQIDVAILMTENSLQLPSWWGIEVQFRNYQIVEMVDLYIQELSDANGGILANMMGLGKTRTMVGMMTIGQAHLLLWIDYTNHLNDPTSTRHLRPEETDTPHIAPKHCPSKTNWGIPCVCSPSSPLYQKAPRLAPTLVTGYGNAVDQWGKEITKVLGGTRWLTGTMPIRVCFLTSNADKNRIEHAKVYTKPTADETREMSSYVDYEHLIEEYNSSAKLRRTYIVGGETHEESPPWQMPPLADSNEQEVSINKIYNHPNARKAVLDANDKVIASAMPAMTAGRFWLLVTQGRLATQFIPSYVRDRTVQLCRRETKKNSFTTVWRNILHPNPIVIGRTVYDEFHNAKSKGTLIVQIYKHIQEKNSRYQSKAWALSGTPMENGAGELITFIHHALTGRRDNSGITNWAEYMLDNKNKRRLVWKNDDYEALADKGVETTAAAWKTWADKLRKSKIKAESIFNDKQYKENIDLGIRICKRWVSRKTLVTEDPQGIRISGVQGKLTVVRRWCPDPGMQGRIKKATDKIIALLGPDLGGQWTQFSREDMLVLASWPGVVDVMLEVANIEPSKWKGLSMSKTLQALQDKPMSEANIFKIYIKELMETSPKWKETEKICKYVKGQIHPGLYMSETNRDQTPFPAKLLIMVAKPVSALITLTAMITEYGEDAVRFAPSTTAKWKPAIDHWRSNNNCRFLVVSSIAFAEAITLIEASFVLLMEPLTRQCKEQQALLRTFRIGQTADEVQGWILCNADSEVERDIVERHGAKTMLRNAIHEDIQGVEEGATGGNTGGGQTWDEPVQVEGIHY